ncbi:hypothetical protein C9I98_18500 [Photobacterium sanctipauli]|uniref:DNA-binding transcriptional repressor CapW winged helix-turn-helix domain-containing protein n=1 Tax=Photobacterium sanctipauli TaxID=1342794 RepID=A0A2T3NPA0_9GAMM|nr:hypothetical protein [Photobacterium sanctipauli]PSW18081.1 hypothetical protein C9I98_18500 [Photobacterium sanctipauli]
MAKKHDLRRIYYKFLEANLLLKGRISLKHDFQKVINLSSTQTTRIVAEYREENPDAIHYSNYELKWIAEEGFIPKYLSTDTDCNEAANIINSVKLLWLN